MNKSEKIIDFESFRSTSSKVFSGRDRGNLIRKELKLEALVEENEKITIIVPSDIYSINTSFFLGLFGTIVRKLGEKIFREKFMFSCLDTIFDDINEGIDRALKEKSVI